MSSFRNAFESVASCVLSSRVNLNENAYSSRVWNRSLISRRDKFFFQRIPKNANSSLVSALNSSLLPVSTRNDVSDLTSALSFRNILYLNQTRLMHNYFKFVFLRDPILRLKSAFADKILMNSTNNIFFHEIQVKTQKKFDRFIDFICEGNEMLNVHWMPQFKQSPINFKDYDFIGRVENLQSDILFIETISNIRFVEIPKLNVTRSNDSISCSRESRRKIEVLYKDDFEIYNLCL